jgi:hypothetical protein
MKKELQQKLDLAAQNKVELAKNKQQTEAN